MGKKTLRPVKVRDMRNVSLYLVSLCYSLYTVTTKTVCPETWRKNAKYTNWISALNTVFIVLILLMSHD